MKTQAQILSLGSVNADFQVRTDRRPASSETLLATEFIRLSGGKAANVAFLARRLGIEARLFAHVGDDDLAEQALQPLREIGVDLAGVQHVAGMATGVAMISVPPDGKKGIVMAANANQAWSAQDAGEIASAVREAAPGSVLVTDCEIAAFAVEQAMRAARQAGLKVLLDPSPADRVDDALLALTDFVLPNAGEAESMTGIACNDAASAIEAGKRLLQRGAAAACVKLHDGGCVLVTADEAVHIPPVPVTVVDTTGAGDAFAGAMAVAVLERRAPAEAARFAVAASHLAVTAYGSQPAYPSRDDIERMQERLRIHVHHRHGH